MRLLTVDVLVFTFARDTDRSAMLVHRADLDVRKPAFRDSDLPEGLLGVRA